ncbi:MAG: hypothetical protein IT383_26780 [Deltaproteobacteria bacterium]|nr:hypothetical protein [Deltaproteobacteria bacterium]
MKLAMSLVGAALVLGCVTLKERHEQAIQSTGRAMERAPGAAREVIAHLEALAGSLAEHNEADRAVVTEAMLERAATFAAKAATGSPDDAATVWQREGSVWWHAKQRERAEAAYRRSVDARPTLPGLAGLMDALGARGAFDDVRAVCGSGAAGLADQELDEHLRRCGQAAHASADTDPAAWLSDADRARYDAWRAERAKRDAVEAKEREDAQRRAEERGRKLAVCSATCDEKAALCRARCDKDQPECPRACEDLAQACAKACEAGVP